MEPKITNSAVSQTLTRALGLEVLLKKLHGDAVKVKPTFIAVQMQHDKLLEEYERACATHSDQFKLPLDSSLAKAYVEMHDAITKAKEAHNLIDMDIDIQVHAINKEFLEPVNQRG